MKGLKEKEQVKQSTDILLRSTDFLSPASFWLPEHYRGSAWIEHAPFAFWLVDVHRPSLLVELGTHTGFSYFSFCQAVKQLGTRSMCYAVDTWKGDEHAGFYGEEIFSDVSKYNDHHYSTFSRLVRSTFDDAVHQFKDRSIDLLHIDGLHSYEAVRRDFEIWLPKLSDRAIVLLHDTKVRERGFGVFRFWSELKNRYPHFEFAHGYGLGVVGVGAQTVAPVRALFGATENRQVESEIHKIYSRLGAGVYDRLLSIDQKKRWENLQQLYASATEKSLELRLALDEGSLVASRLEQELLATQHRKEDLERTNEILLSDNLNLAREIIVSSRLNAQLELSISEHSAENSRTTARRILAEIRAAALDLALKARSSEVLELKAGLTSTQSQLTAAQSQGSGLAMALKEKEKALQSVEDSILWRVTSPLRAFRNSLRSLEQRLRRVRKRRKNKISLLPDPFVSISQLQRPVDRYSAWLECNVLNAAAVDALRASLMLRQTRLPLISVIMPVFNTPLELLEEAIQSVRAKVYENWELCIADDASWDKSIENFLAKWAARDSRIRFVSRTSNGGISAATNSAAALATGEFLAFLDHDDLLTPDALAEVAIYIADRPDTDIVYSDDDKIDMSGRRYDPQFKPDWSPTLLLSYMYLSHLLVVRRTIFEDLGGTKIGLEGSQDYDLALRASENSRHIGHLPRVLYHWRAVPNSVAATTDAKPQSLTTGLRAVSDAFNRRGLDAIVTQSEWAQNGKVGIYSADFPDDGPRVAILISSRNRLDLLKPCLASLTKTTYRNYEVVIVDDESDELATLEFLGQCGHRVLRVPRPENVFSFSHMNNVAARGVEADYILLLNNDTEVINPRWLSQMVGYARMPGVGAVGAKLIYGENTIQHAGVVNGLHNGLAGHAFRNLPADQWGYLSYLKVAREYSGVTAACLLTPRDLFLELGGFDEKVFTVAYNDVDYCYRLNDRGFRCIFCPDALLLHYEGRSRRPVDKPSELAAARRNFRGRVDHYYNPNLSLENEHFEIHPYHHPRVDGHAIRTAAISHNLNSEGAPICQFELLRGLKRRGVLDPIVFSPVDGPLRFAYEAAGIPVKIIAPNLSGELEFEETVGAMARELREDGFELVYANTRVSFWAIVVAEKAKLPAIWNIRESEPWNTYYDYLPSPLRQVALRSYQYPYRVVFVSNASRKVSNELNSRFNFSVVHDGLDIERLESRTDFVDRATAREMLGIADAEISLVMVGTVCERKGQIDLVRAFSLLPEDLGIRLRLFIVGDRASPYSDLLHAEIRSLQPHLAARVTVVPETPDPYRYFRAGDVAICCSRIESYPRVTLEAMAFGLPLVTTPVFGIAEQVREGVNALFYQPGDVGQLAAHLAQIVCDRSMRLSLGANALPVLNSLPSIDEMLDGYERTFREAYLSRGDP